MGRGGQGGRRGGGATLGRRSARLRRPARVVRIDGSRVVPRPPTRRPHEHDRARPDTTASAARRRGGRAARLRRDPLPQRGGEHRGVRRARALARDATSTGIPGEVVVADNGSEDRSAELAAAAGARVVHEPRRGYGSAYLAGFAAARGRYIVMADADLTYDFDEIPRFVEQLDDGADLVMGDRMDNIQPGRDAVAAPLRRQPGPHRHPQPLLPHRRQRRALRHARRCAATCCRALDLRTTGMEFASEMVIRASKEKLDIREFPIEYHPRGGESKLSSFRDGWRHLRFLLVHSPTHLFMHPGRASWRCSARSIALIVLAADRHLRPRVGPAHDDRRRAADDRRHAGRRARPRARTPTARTSWARRTRGSTACARASGSSTACCSAAPSSLVGLAIAARHRRHLDRPRLRRAVRGAPRGPRGDADHRRHPDLLLVVPAQHPRPAPAVRSGAAEARQLRQHVLTANDSRLRLPSEEVVRRLIPGPIGTSDISPAQVADAVLAHHGLVAIPRLRQPSQATRSTYASIESLPVKVPSRSRFVRVLRGLVLRPVYGLILLSPGWPQQGSFEGARAA